VNGRDGVSARLFVYDYETGLNYTHAQVTRRIRTDCLLYYDTVKYFDGEEYEA
jgi:ABC-type transport system involved in Fe-S cluster assembly fused permease/ATPase subunit